MARNSREGSCLPQLQLQSQRLPRSLTKTKRQRQTLRTTSIVKWRTSLILMMRFQQSPHPALSSTTRECSQRRKSRLTRRLLRQSSQLHRIRLRQLVVSYVPRVGAQKRHRRISHASRAALLTAGRALRAVSIPVALHRNGPQLPHRRTPMRSDRSSRYQASTFF